MNLRMLKMARTLFLSLCLLLGLACGAVTPGLSAAKCFTEAPAQVLPLLSVSNRLDMVDYFRAGSAKTTVNAAGGNARVTEESDYSIKFQVSEGVTGQMFVLNPMDKCPVIGYIETVELPMPDSAVKFFNCRWQPVEVFKAPELRDWTRNSDKATLEQLREEVPFVLCTMEYLPREAELVLAGTTEQYFSKDDTPEALSQLKDEIVMRWTGKKFKIKE